MAVAPEAEALVRQMYDAFNRQDIRAALAAAHPDVTWPNALEETRVTGLDNIAEYLERQFRVLDLRMDVLSVREGEDGAVVVQVHQVARFLSDGAPLADDVVEHIFHLRDGLIVSADARGPDGDVIGPRERQSSDA